MRWIGAQQWWLGLRSVCTNLGFLLDVGMYVPSKIFQASQQSVKLLSSPHQHDVDGKVSPVLPRLAEQCHPVSWSCRVLQGCKGRACCLVRWNIHG